MYIAIILHSGSDDVIIGRMRAWNGYVGWLGDGSACGKKNKFSSSIVKGFQ